MTEAGHIHAAVEELWSELPELVGADWPRVRPQLTDLLASLGAGHAPDPMALVKLVDLLSQYPAARERFLELLAEQEEGSRGGFSYGPGRLKRDAEPPARRIWPEESVTSPAADAAETDRTRARYVNALVTSAGTDQPVATEHPLRLSSDYELLVSIGRYFDGNLLPRSEAAWPEEMLPDQGLWLRAALIVDGMREPAVRPFYLPRDGESFSCDCPVNGEHAAACARRPWVRFALRTPDLPAILRGELVIYYQAAAVVALRLTLPAGLATGDGVWVAVIGRLTSTFNDLGKLARRTASVVVSSGSSRVVVNGTTFVDNPFAIAASAADTSALNARTVLHTSAFETRGDALYSRYDRHFGKAYADYEDDLRRLAREGAALYSRLFSDPAVAFALPSLIRHEARTRGRPPVLQVLDDRFDEHAMLWAGIYDLPVGSDTARYVPCQSVRDFGPGGAAGDEIPAVCPYDADHDRRSDVLCPFGFWGLSCIVEQPPTVPRDLESVVFDQAGDMAVFLAVGPALDTGITRRHLGELQTRLPSLGVINPDLTTADALGLALGPEDMDVVYFYCHGGYRWQSDKASPDRYLELNGYIVGPLDVNSWARTAWPDPHWPRRHPLVVLNGCHTIEVTSGTLNSFVPAFTQWGGAAGVLGTEISIDQGVASWVMEEVLARLAQGHSIGAAVHGTRWVTLRRGNLMGLAYTPYCLANLVLRTPAHDLE